MFMLKFSSQEIKDIIISTVVLAIVFGGIGEGFLPALFVVGIAFLSHELLGHKLAAQYFGCEAVYKKWTSGLAFALIGSFFGVIFAAPGAVYIRPGIRKGFAWNIHRLTKQEYGIISLAGPAVNIILGFFFILTMPFFGEYVWLMTMAARISLFLAMFNLLPFGPLDGSKISAWSWYAWGTAMALAGIGYIFLI
jgi:Zn-dependent protease